MKLDILLYPVPEIRKGLLDISRFSLIQGYIIESELASFMSDHSLSQRKSLLQIPKPDMKFCTVLLHVHSFCTRI